MDCSVTFGEYNLPHEYGFKPRQNAQGNDNENDSDVIATNIEKIYFALQGAQKNH